MQTRTTIGWLAVASTVVTVAGCGNKTRYANNPRPALPVNLTVYINNSRVSVSPASVGAGPVILEVTNQAATAQSISVAPAGGGGSLASTGPINPEGTAQISVNVSRGQYVVSTATSGTDAQQAQASSIAAAKVHVGTARPSADGNLLSP